MSGESYSESVRCLASLRDGTNLCLMRTIKRLGANKKAGQSPAFNSPCLIVAVYSAPAMIGLFSTSLNPFAFEQHSSRE